MLLRGRGADPAESQEETGTGQNGKEVREEEEENDMVTEGTEEYRGFLLDNVLHSGENGDIHYNLYVPESYDGSRPYALFITLPGYEGLYFQGVGENLYQESFGFEAQNYISDMIILAPQLEDWGETSASQTIALTEYFLEHYNIDTSRVYIEGYSGGGRPFPWCWEADRSFTRRPFTAVPSGTVHMNRWWKTGRPFTLSLEKMTNITAPNLPGRPMILCTACTGKRDFRKKRPEDCWYWT